MKPSLRDTDIPTTDGRLKRLFLYATITAACALGIYSLFLASARADKVKPLPDDGLIRTASAKDHDRIALASGANNSSELTFVVIEDPLGPSELELERIARRVAQDLADSGLAASVRRLEPIDPDYARIVAQNTVGFFPAIMVAKKNGGIVLVTEDYSPENLLNTYYTVWGKNSDCGAARDAVY